MRCCVCNTEGDEQRMNTAAETLMQNGWSGLLLLCAETHQPSREIAGVIVYSYRHDGLVAV